jgi:hypothetical protein
MVTVAWGLLTVIGAWPDAAEEEEMILDVMVLYTPEVRSMESQLGVEGGARLSIAYLNEAFRQSLIPARARLVYLGETVWHRDSGSVASELGWLMNDPVVADLLERFGADLVALRVLPGSGPRGMACFDGPFSVWTGHPRVFAHEIGHNLGCGHARQEAGSCAPLHAFGYGYVTVPPSGQGVPCGDIMSSVAGPPLFSNPSVSYLGAAMGVPIGHLNAYGMPNSADAAQAITLELHRVSQRRPVRAPRLAHPKLRADGMVFEFQVLSGGEPCGIEWTADGLTWSYFGQAPASSDLVTVQDQVGGVETRSYRAWAVGRLLNSQVGFVRRNRPAGLSLISNPFDNGDNAVSRLLPELPHGTILFKWDESAQNFTSSTMEDGLWSSQSMRLHPGEGAVLWLPTPQTIQFTGMVLDSLYRIVPAGWSLQGVPFPYPGDLMFRFAYPSTQPSTGQLDEIYLYSTQKGCYEMWQSSQHGGNPGSGPCLQAGDGFWSFKRPNSHQWNGVLWPGMECVR